MAGRGYGVGSMNRSGLEKQSREVGKPKRKVNGKCLHNASFSSVYVSFIIIIIGIFLGFVLSNFQVLLIKRSRFEMQIAFAY